MPPRDVPLDLALLLDTSASMTDKMQTMQEAAVGFAATLRAGDRVSIVDIKDTVKVLHALDDDLGRGRHGDPRAPMARGGTALYNGLYMTLKEMVKQRAAERRGAPPGDCRPVGRRGHGEPRRASTT